MYKSSQIWYLVWWHCLDCLKDGGTPLRIPSFAMWKACRISCHPSLRDPKQVGKVDGVDCFACGVPLDDAPLAVGVPAVAVNINCEPCFIGDPFQGLGHFP